MKLTPFICSTCGYASSTAGPQFIPSCPNHSGVAMVMTRAKLMTAEDIRTEQENNEARSVPVPPTGTAEAVAHIVKSMEGRPPEDHNRTLLYRQEHTISEGK